MKTQRGPSGCNQDLKGSLFCCPASHLSVIQPKSLVSFTAWTQWQQSLQLLHKRDSESLRYWLKNESSIIIRRHSNIWHISREYLFDIVMLFGEWFLSTLDTFIFVCFPPHNISCIQKSFGGMYYWSYSLEVRFQIILNKDQLLPYLK